MKKKGPGDVLLYPGPNLAVDAIFCQRVHHECVSIDGRTIDN